jgi:hypothetical protein
MSSISYNTNKEGYPHYNLRKEINTFANMRSYAIACVTVFASLLMIGKS